MWINPDDARLKSNPNKNLKPIPGEITQNDEIPKAYSYRSREKNNINHYRHLKNTKKQVHCQPIIF